MVHRNSYKRIVGLVLLGAASLGFSGTVSAFTQGNFFRPYDSALHLPLPKKGMFRLTAQGEYGDKRSGRNWDGVRSNVLALHDNTQSTLAMIKNTNDAHINQLNKEVTALMGQPILDDDGAQAYLGNPGYQKFTGDFCEYDLNVVAGFKLPLEEISGTISIEVYLPFVKKEISDVKIEDLTRTNLTNPNINAVNEIIKRELTNDLATNVKQWSNLDLSAWKKTGLGDIAVMVDWRNKYDQNKEYLQKVGLFAKLGLTLPTSPERDEDKAFSMPLGNDGAMAIPFGMGMELDFVHNIRAGVDVDFLVILDHERTRRLKTAKDQTEFLLLNKGLATKEYGLNWQFHLYLQVFDICKCVSARAAYQFVKHDEDRLLPKRNDFDYAIINTAHSLGEWNSHDVIFSLNYDAFKHCPNLKVSPQVNLFYKLPVGGKNYIDNATIGGQLALNF
ncbi:MAG: hypothetical protein ABH827_02555 [bacterium]